MTAQRKHAERVLIVEDDPATQTTLERIFRNEGYNTVVASNVDEAQCVLRYEPCDLVLTDIIMPKKDGIDLLRFIKGHWPSTEVILITAYASVDTAIQALREGAADYVTKPYDPQYLLEKVRRCLDGRTVKEGIDLPALAQHYHLTSREQQIIGQLIEGRRNAKIAHELCITEGTVKNHLTTIFHKFGVKSRTELLARLRRTESPSPTPASA